MADPFELGRQHGAVDVERGLRSIYYRPPDDFDLEEFDEYMLGYAEGKQEIL